MKKGTLWVIIFGLVVVNSITIALYLSNKSDGEKTVPAQVSVGTETVVTEQQEEVIATIGNINITRQEWISQLENNYGKEVLKSMIDRHVIEQMANKYKIQVSDKELDQEVAFATSMYEYEGGSVFDDKAMREYIKYNILLEELLTKDVEIPEKDLKAFYEDNIGLYHSEPALHLSQIVISSKEEADQVIAELNSGSNFAALAMERSIDEYSAPSGGDLGFVSLNSHFIDKSVMEELKHLEEQEFSKPIQVDQGYAVFFVQEKTEGLSLDYEDVKKSIRRQMAIEQMGGTVSAEIFWKEANVTWFYGKE
ncbi:peptidyl-prolyl cis-trans isomerase [Bacillus salinus]|uniref:peptidyl-prolyl cis-trans isomerase n=1 Tax=Bacillus sp. HMF5848 TaxID=2495421 RepID=UPI00163A7644|nr:peptidyl-prolyl cis-trans isomerase [Bacillus sp. HMF5848]